jgi:hypothetical protein
MVPEVPESLDTEEIVAVIVEKFGVPKAWLIRLLDVVLLENMFVIEYQLEDARSALDTELGAIDLTNPLR